MSFAVNAAPFSQNNNDENNLNIIEQKRNNRNKTIKNIKKDTSSVEALIQRLHDTDSDDNALENFTPIESKKETPTDKQMVPVNNQNKNNANSASGSVEPFSRISNVGNINDYSNQYLPTYNKMSENTSGNRELLEKLNYMINLLENQQDESTGHVTEEIILYSFLGVFIIFIVDSFARVGKYVR
jgi:hypothetical protein